MFEFLPFARVRVLIHCHGERVYDGMVPTVTTDGGKSPPALFFVRFCESVDALPVLCLLTAYSCP